MRLLSIQLNEKEVEVIDFHVHTFPDEIANRAITKLESIANLSAHTNGTIVDTIEKMKLHHIDKSVLLNIATTPFQQTTINNNVKTINDEYSDFLIAFGSVHFLNEDCINELERIKELGIKGIKLHPDYQEFMIDDERLFPIYEKCQALQMPIVFHAGWDCYSPECIHARPEASRNVLNTFPKLKMILAHMGGIHCWDDVEKYLIGENVYLDTSMCHTYANKAQIERMIQMHDEDKILFGSDCPWENPSNTIAYILSMKLSDQLKENIFSANAKKLLNLD